jgi:hypothetical protein
VIELGAAVTNDRPLTEQLARALGDPQLQLRYRVPNFGWVDEQGHPATEPSAPTGVVTRAAAPGGGEVALLHSRGDPRLAAAAAGAAALALDSARLEAEARARAAEMRASRHRLLSAADAERRSLEEQLSEGPLARLRRVDRLIAGSDAEPLRDELHAAMTELTALARGLYPPALTRADLAAALTDMAVRSAVPVTIAVAGDLRTISDDARATAWFVCSEALANVARHSGATHATVSLAIETNALAIEIADNGHGGAIPQRGLRGLADRIEAQGGALTLESPAGGPTVIRARI